MRSHRTKRYRLPAHTSVPYSWDNPSLKDKKIILNIAGRERSISMQEIGSQLPFRHQVSAQSFEYYFFFYLYAISLGSLWTPIDHSY